MTLYLIGIGLATEKDITVSGLEIVKKCDEIYLESYTSLLQCSVNDLEIFYGKKIIIANREMSEQGSEKIIEKAKEKEIVFLIVGDPFSATTHTEIFKTAKLKGISVRVINNASVLTAVGITGLQLYKFGKTTSIPFIEDHPNLETPYNVIWDNLSLGLHTLCLLDLNPEEGKFMQVSEAIDILLQIEKKKNRKIINEETLVVGCSRLGSDDFVIKFGKIKDIKKIEFGPAPHCLIIPGKLHFSEEEMVNLLGV